MAQLTAPVGCSLFSCTLAAAVVLSLPLLLFIWQRRDAAPAARFHFTRLPAEIRDLVYEELVEPDCNPRFPAEMARSNQPSLLGWLPHRRQLRHRKHGIMLANRQLHDEFMHVLCKKATFTLTIDCSNERSARLWPVQQDTMSRIRKAEVRVIATSDMLGARDPRSMPREWALRERVSRSLGAMKRVESIKLHVHAVPDRMWNPLWLWSQVSQQFKDLEEPQFDAITFGLEPWSLGENHLRRDGNRWTWRCPGDHVVMEDPEGWQPIREFCAALYLECHDCQKNQRGAS